MKNKSIVIFIRNYVRLLNKYKHINSFLKAEPQDILSKDINWINQNHLVIWEFIEKLQKNGANWLKWDTSSIVLKANQENSMTIYVLVVKCQLNNQTLAHHVPIVVILKLVTVNVLATKFQLIALNLIVRHYHKNKM